MAGSIKIAGHELVRHDIATDKLVYGSGVPAGTVLQVKSQSSTSPISDNTGTYVDFLTANITPTASGNKIYILSTIQTYHVSAGSIAQGRIYRDSTNLGYEFSDYYTATGSGLPGNINIQFLDAPTIPATPIQIEYKIQIHAENGTISTNKDFYGANTGISTLTLMEIQQ